MSLYYSRLAQRAGFGAVVKPQISDENACIRKERHSSNEIAEAIVCDSTLLFLLIKEHISVLVFGAENRIWTCGTFQFARFPSVCLKPLDHLCILLILLLFTPYSIFNWLEVVYAKHNPSCIIRSITNFHRMFSPLDHLCIYLFSSVDLQQGYFI